MIRASSWTTTTPSRPHRGTSPAMTTASLFRVSPPSPPLPPSLVIARRRTCLLTGRYTMPTARPAPTQINATISTPRIRCTPVVSNASIEPGHGVAADEKTGPSAGDGGAVGEGRGGGRRKKCGFFKAEPGNLKNNMQKGETGKHKKKAMTLRVFEGRARKPRKQTCKKVRQGKHRR